jgi:hypothetical protein
MSRTLNESLIRNTKATITNDNVVSYTYPKTRSGLANTYSILGLNVSIETLKERGWNLYETSIRVGTTGHWTSPTGFDEWYKTFKKTSLGYEQVVNRPLVIFSEGVENPSANKLAKAHELGGLVGESYALAIINKYIELLFTDVAKEGIERQIAELNSQLSAIA